MQPANAAASPQPQATERAPEQPRADVPIRAIPQRHRSRILQHLLCLQERDRYLRFGHMANNEQIVQYVQALDFDKDDLFGIYNRALDLVAVAHLSYSHDPQHREQAEFGVSVAQTHRGRGFGTQLFERATLHARNRGVHTFFIQALSENKAMLKIARNAGSSVQRDGPESEAHLVLPPPSMSSRIEELYENNLARVDYRFKKYLHRLFGSKNAGKAAHMRGQGV